MQITDVMLKDSQAKHCQSQYIAKLSLQFTFDITQPQDKEGLKLQKIYETFLPLQSRSERVLAWLIAV